MSSPGKDKVKKKDGGTGTVDIAVGGPGGESVSYDVRQRIQDALDNATPALPYGAGLVDRVEAGWDVLTRPDGLLVRLEPRPGATAALRATAGTLVTGLDLSAAALASAEVTALRAQAKQLFDALDAEGKRDRAIASILLDEVNALRDWITSFKAAVAGAATLAALKTAVALLPNVPDRTAAQARTAYRNRLDDGSVDGALS